MAYFNGGLNGSKIIKMPDLIHIPDSKGVGSVFFHSMLKNKHKIAQIDAATGESDTYGALLQRCIRTAVAMRSHQVTSNDIISICSTNHLDTCVPFISTFFLGGTVASLDPLLSARDTAHLLSLVRPKLIFVSSDAIGLVENAIELCGVNTKVIEFGNTTAHVPFSTFLEENEDENNFRPCQIETLTKDALILFSSGTSGLPKGIRLSHHCYLGQLAVFGDLDDCYSRMLIFSTLYWTSAVTLCGSSIINGVSRIMQSKFDVNTTWQTIHTHKVTFIFMSPYQMICMHKDGRPNHIRVDSLQTICIGGGPLSEEQVVAMKQMLPTVRVFLTYGLTETGFTSYFRNRNEEDLSFFHNKPGSSGSGVLGMSYKIVDPNTEEVLGPNETGELRLKTKYMLSGYYNIDSSNIWDSDGWFKTGDVAYYDDDYYFYIVGRLKEMLKFRSFHVLPETIENVILTHPGVKSAVVVGVPHEIDGDHPMAVVMLKVSHSCISEEELIKYVEERVDDRERLRGGVKIIKDLPLTPTGKMDRRLIKKMVSESY